MERVLKPMLIFLVLLLSVFLLMGCTQEVQIDEASIVTGTGTVTDRAMAFPNGSGKLWDESFPYLTVKFEDGTELCVWNKRDVNVPDDIQIGDTVEITYGPQENTDHLILVDIKELS